MACRGGGMRTASGQEGAVTLVLLVTPSSSQKRQNPGPFSPTRCFSVRPTPASPGPPLCSSLVAPLQPTGLSAVARHRPGLRPFMHSSRVWTLPPRGHMAHDLLRQASVTCHQHAMCNLTPPSPTLLRFPVCDAVDRVLGCCCHALLEAGTCLSLAGPLGRSTAW